MRQEDKKRLEALNADHHVRMAADAGKRPEVGATGVLIKDHASRANILQAMCGARSRFVEPAPWEGPKGTLLELGSGHCGDREVLLSTLRAEKYVGLEVVPHIAALYKSKGVLNKALEELPPKLFGKCRWVYSRHVMEHTADVALALDNIYKALEPGGVCGAVTPHYFPDPEPAHIAQHRLEEWMDFYRQHKLMPVYAVLEQHNCAEAHIVVMREEDVHGL